MVSKAPQELSPEEKKKEQERRISSLLVFLQSNNKYLAEDEKPLVDGLAEAMGGKIVQDIGSTSFLEFINMLSRI